MAGTEVNTTPNPRYAWYVVGMLWAISFFNYADRQAIFSVFPLLEKELGLNAVQLGLLGSSFAWVYGLMGPFAGYVVDRVSRKTAILSGLQIWSVICAATALCRTFPQLLAFRAAEGLGETVYYPASMSMVADYHGWRTRSRAMGLHQTSVYVGTIGGGFFAGAIAQRYGWRWSFIVFGGLGMLLGLALKALLREPVRGSAEGGSREFERNLPASEVTRIVFSTPTIPILIAAFMCANFVAVVLLTWMPKFLFDRFHMNLAMSGLTATLFVQLASFAGSPLGGWLADIARQRTTRGRLAVQATGVLCGAPFVVWCGLTQSVGALMLALTAWGFFKGLYDGNIWASLFDVVPPNARGSIAGIMNAAAWLGGGGSAPLVIGVIAQGHGLGLAIALASIIYVCAGILLIAGMLLFIQKDSLANVASSRSVLL